METLHELMGVAQPCEQIRSFESFFPNTSGEGSGGFRLGSGRFRRFQGSGVAATCQCRSQVAFQTFRCSIHVLFHRSSEVAAIAMLSLARSSQVRFRKVLVRHGAVSRLIRFRKAASTPGSTGFHCLGSARPLFDSTLLSRIVVIRALRLPSEKQQVGA